jgi:MSHA pilin protein MshA
MKKINKQAGFTLIEIIMVIVILGVLSAFALPRFADLGGEAREASISGLSGAIKAAANIAHAQQLADGNSGSDSVDLDGVTITMETGYPTADANGIGKAAQIDADDYTATTPALPLGSILYSIQANCSVSYTPDTAVVDKEISGC